nr:MAG TPA: hypothetical protein [Caudoviricetes sp.]
MNEKTNISEKVSIVIIDTKTRVITNRRCFSIVANERNKKDTKYR